MGAGIESEVGRSGENGIESEVCKATVQAGIESKVGMSGEAGVESEVGKSIDAGIESEVGKSGKGKSGIVSEVCKATVEAGIESVVGKYVDAGVESEVCTCRFESRASGKGHGPSFDELISGHRARAEASRQVFLEKYGAQLEKQIARYKCIDKLLRQLKVEIANSPPGRSRILLKEKRAALIAEWKLI